MNEIKASNLNDETEFAKEIINNLKEYAAGSLIHKITEFLGVERTKEFYKLTQKIESSGGVMTARGSRRRTPGGVFLFLVKNNVSAVEKELLFPDGRNSLSEDMQENIKHLSSKQIRIGIERLEQIIKESVSLSINERNRLLYKKELLLKIIADLNNQEESQSIAGIKDAIEGVTDEDARSSLIARIEEFEKVASEKFQIKKQYIDVEQERLRMQIKLEAEERRAKTKLEYLEKFLERESVATLIGSLLLLIITVVLLIGMFTGKIESKIIENGFLVLLGYFFGQTISRKEKKEKNTN